MAHADTDLTNPPPIRSGCLGLLINYADAVLMVRPTYKDDGLYQLPGGGARENEPPWEATRREVLEETGLHVQPRRLLVLDWISAKPEKNIAAGANYVYWCGRVPDHTAVTLPEPRNDHEDPELDHYRWLRRAELEGYCAPYQARRVRAALQARVHGTLMELRHGHPLYEEAV